MEIFMAEHQRFEKNLEANTKLTKEIAENTAEMVDLIRGVKGVRTLIVWGMPIIVMCGAVIAFIREWK